MPSKVKALAEAARGILREWRDRVDDPELSAEDRRLIDDEVKWGMAMLHGLELAIKQKSAGAIHDAAEQVSGLLDRLEEYEYIAVAAERNALILFANVGAKVKRSGRIGQEIAHGTPEERQQNYDLWQADLERRMAANSHLSFTAARHRTAEAFGVSFKTVERRTTKPRTKTRKN